MIDLPTFAALHITDKCSHHCPYCYAGKGLNTESPADFDTLCNIVLALKRNGIKTIALLGGDPVKYEKIYDLLSFIKKYTSINVELLSNTLVIENHLPSEIAPLVSCVETTIHGNRLFHDNLCGVVGAFDNIVEQLHCYSELGVNIDVDINIIPDNINELFTVIDYLIDKKKIKINNVLIQRIIPFGNAEGSTKYNLSREELNIALSQIYEAKEKYKFNVIAEDTFPFCAVKPQFRQFLRKCEWGTKKFAINSEGKISRCGADPTYTLGNILTDDLKTIWQNSKELLYFREKSFVSSKCKKCIYFDNCGGGCPLSTLPTGTLGIDYLSIE